MQNRPTKISCAHARRAFADRVTEAAAVYGAAGELLAPRKRVRRWRGVMFREWARREYGKRATHELSPKLARIVHGAT